jgi:rhamnosyltransferase
MSVVAIIVTYNPELSRFRYVLNQASKQANHVIIVDNDSKTKDMLKKLCNKTNNCDFVEIGFNSGVAHALRIGIKHSIKYNPDWLLFLDDDTVLLGNAIVKSLDLINSLPSIIKSKVGAVLLGSINGKCNINVIDYGPFSGTLVKASIAERVCCRDDFFLDQADHDVDFNIRRLGYLVLGINCRLINHKLGIKRWIPILSNMLHRSVSYEPPWRYYYIIRNSTRLLIEGKMNVTFYTRQLIDSSIRIFFADGPWALIKPLGLGIIHALLNELGYVDSRFFT